MNWVLRFLEICYAKRWGTMQIDVKNKDILKNTHATDQ